VGFLPAAVAFLAAGRKLDACLPRLGKADRYRLFGGAGAMLSLPDVVNLFPNEFPGLGRW
jgi:hypothetical protein